MKALLSLIISGALVVSGYSQTRNVLVGTNNVVVQPTNFWSADASNARTGLGLGTAATNPASAFQPASSALTNLVSGNGGALTNLQATNLVGLIPTSNIPSIVLTSIGTITIAQGGTSATNAANARQNLGSTTVGDAVFIATNAAAARTAIGATTAGSSLFTLVNPSAIAFLRLNADNTATALSAADFRTAIGLPLAALASTNASNFRVAIGATTIGNALFTATNSAAAIDAIGISTNLSDQVLSVSNIVIGDFSSGSALGFVAPTSGRTLRVVGTNVSTAVPAFFGWNGFIHTAFSAAEARTNLGLGWSALTNTVASNFRTAVGLGATDQVSFSNIQVESADIDPNPTNLSIKFDTNTTNMTGISGGSSFPKRIVFHVDGGTVSVFSNAISAENVSGTKINVGTNGMTFSTSGIYVTRSNLGLIGTGTNSVIGGGENNQSTGNGSVVGGGDNNVSSSLNSTVSGGRNNTASGSRSTVAGGEGNTASGTLSFASGRRSQATNTGAFVFSDSTDADFSSTNDNSFNIRAGGGVSLDLGTNGINFRNATNAAVTRTNLGLGASWLISTNTPVFVSTNGEVVSPTNFWQAAPINTVLQNITNVVGNTTNAATNARMLFLYSLAPTVTNVTSTITLPTNGTTFGGDVATITHLGSTSSVTAIRALGAGTNIITLNQPEESVRFIYRDSGWTLMDNISYIEPIFFSGTNAAANAAESRTNLGLPLEALTNTSVTNFQKAIFYTNTAPSNIGGNLGTIAAWIEIVASNGVTYKIPAYTNVP